MNHDRKPNLPGRREVLAGLAATGMLAGLGPAAAQSRIRPGSDSVLLVVDVQNCFLPGGTLPVKGGNEIIPVINALGKKFANVIFTQDWHTPGHSSFASACSPARQRKLPEFARIFAFHGSRNTAWSALARASSGYPASMSRRAREPQTSAEPGLNANASPTRLSASARRPADIARSARWPRARTAAGSARAAR